MRLLLLALSALLVVAAGCAQNRTAQPDVAPSRMAAATDPGAGWSVPPGQKTVTDPVDARQPGESGQPEVAARTAQPDEAALAEAERRRREEAARVAREELRRGQTSREQPSREQPVVQPLVPAFPARLQEQRVPALRTVHFAFDQWELTSEAQALLDENARWMKANPEIVVQVGGHADERGTPEYNLALGEKRAKRVREYLITQGVPADNLVTASYGEEMPLETGHEERSWSRNRRAEFNRADGRQVSGTEGATPRS
jgi:peptidoglycan-associated lipoprotein